MKIYEKLSKHERRRATVRSTTHPVAPAQPLRFSLVLDFGSEGGIVGIDVKHAQQPGSGS